MHESRAGSSPGGCTRSIHDGGPTELHISNPPNIHEPEILDGKNTWHQKIQDLNISVLIYSIKQTLRPKKKNT